MVALTLLIAILGGCNQQSSETIRFYVGSYAPADQSGIYCCELDISSGKIVKTKELKGIENPSFLALHPNKEMLYAVGETTVTSQNDEGTVWSIALDQIDGSMNIVNSVSSGGAHPCHLSLDKNSKYLLVANYSGGNVSMIPVFENLRLGHPVGVHLHELKGGPGPVTNRQQKAHAHSINISQDNSIAYACDLGTDEVIAYRLNIEEEMMMPDIFASYTCEPGAGPRHLALSPDGMNAYLINELNSTMVTLKVDPSGKIYNTQTISTLPDDYNGENFCADVHVHPDGKYVYGSNRGHNSIVVFERAPSGSLSLIQHQKVSGDWPRNFAISPSGEYLIVANQRSDNIVVFRIDQSTGELIETGEEFSLSKPVCIVFVS